MKKGKKKRDLKKRGQKKSGSRITGGTGTTFMEKMERTKEEWMHSWGA